MDIFSCGNVTEFEIQGIFQKKFIFDACLNVCLTYMTGLLKFIQVKIFVNFVNFQNLLTFQHD